MSPEDRMDALVDVLAEGFLHLAMTGQLEEVLSDKKVDSLPSARLVAGKDGKASELP